MSICYISLADTATTEIYTLSLHDALLISTSGIRKTQAPSAIRSTAGTMTAPAPPVVERRAWTRSEEHTSELQSRVDLVCRLLLEKKNVATKNWVERQMRWLPAKLGTDCAL